MTLKETPFLNPDFSLKELFTHIAKIGRTVLEVDGCTIYRLEADGETLTPVAAEVSAFAEEVLSTNISVNDSFTGESVKAGQALIFNDAGVISGGHHIPGTPVETDERILASPFIIDGEVFAAMCLDRKGTFFIGAELALAEAFAAYASRGIKTAQNFWKLQNKIEELKQKQEKKLAPEEYFRIVLENLTEAAFVSRGGMLMFVNSAASEIFASPAEKLIFRTFAEFVHPDDRDIAFENHINWCNGGQFPHTFVLRILDKENYQKSVEVNSIMIEWESEPAVLNFMNDITEK